MTLFRPKAERDYQKHMTFFRPNAERGLPETHDLF